MCYNYIKANYIKALTVFGMLANIESLLIFIFIYMIHRTTVNMGFIVDYFLYKGQQEKIGISNKKLQKLLYYSQAWFLAIKKIKLFDDGIEAWVHGPAIRSVYVEYKNFGGSYIEKEIDLVEIGEMSQRIKKFLDGVWSVYGKKDAGYLELLTHSETPWQEARMGLQRFENSANLISEKSMKEYYSKKLRQVEAKKI